ncbi:hypothetical protein K439DRAFT_1388061, partial [Ramaria rubella]
MLNPSRDVSCCHCSNCKKYTGTVFTMNVVFPAARTQTHRLISGEELITVYHDTTQDSGNVLLRHFCSNCGSPLFNTNGDFGRTMAVFYSALDGFIHESQVGPEIEYYAKDRVRWLPDFPGAQRAKTKPGRD